MKTFVAAILLAFIASPVLANSTHDTTVTSGGDVTNNNTATGFGGDGGTAVNSTVVKTGDVNLTQGNDSAESKANADADARATGGTANATGGRAKSESNSGAVGVGSVSTKFDAEKPATASSATLVLGTCQSGASAQTFQAGASIGSPDDVCLLFTASQVAQAQGNNELAAKLLGEAVDILKIRTNPVRRFLQGVPVIGRLM